MADEDFWCYDPDKIDYTKLDPGIREVVRALVQLGFHTTDSGDGESKLTQGWEQDDIVPYPHVYMEVNASDIAYECDRLQAWLRGEHGIDIVQAWTEEGKPHIEALYDPMGAALIGLFNVTSGMLRGVTSGAV